MSVQLLRCAAALLVFLAAATGAFFIAARQVFRTDRGARGVHHAHVTPPEHIDVLQTCHQQADHVVAFELGQRMAGRFLAGVESANQANQRDALFVFF